MFTTASLKLSPIARNFQSLLWLLLSKKNHKPMHYQNNNLISGLNANHQIRCKSYHRFLDYSKVPKLEEKDLKESFVRGSGPGGQATNKTNNAVVLQHEPTGLTVKCHQTRSLSQNRKIARELLLTKLDNLINKEESLENQKLQLQKRDSLKRKQKQKKLAKLKEEFKKCENIE